ncbi:hypothetical protein X971_4821 (plasmid) [Agrobacterium tumefaciens LBA4213 (Ach5)]|nr:hypothetical protein X971_4821 [Agrobacterium tumefaciens LBA4213 (Ach5)]
MDDPDDPFQFALLRLRKMSDIRFHGLTIAIKELRCKLRTAL